MARILSGDIALGVAVYLDNVKIREKSDCASSAWIDDHEKDHSIKRPHYFLILEEIKDDIWLAAPLSSQQGDHKQPLDPNLKGGALQKWFEKPSFFYERQFWQLTTRAVSDRVATAEAEPRW